MPRIGDRMDLNFKVGDSVSIKGASSVVVKVIEIWASNVGVDKYEVLIGVDFGVEIVGGHNCRGAGPDNQCSYILDYKLEKVGVE